MLTRTTPSRAIRSRSAHLPAIEPLENRCLLSAVLTWHNDLARTGQNLTETTLTPANVNAATFGKLFNATLDGQVYAQPLYVPGVQVSGQGQHNVLFAATQHDSVYALDAATGSVLWKDSFINPAAGITTVPTTDLGTQDIVPEVGITGTPVIDPASQTLFVVAKTKEVANGVTTYVQRLHALDITSGAEKSGGPVVISAAVPGTGAGADAQGQVHFDPLWNNQRSALLLLNGVVYISWASHGDHDPYHGWVIGYNAATLNQTCVWNANPDGTRAGIWMSGAAPSADSAGKIYLSTGNGTFNANTGGKSYGDSVLKLMPSGSTLQVLDYFTPYNQAALQSADKDLGSGGVLLLPDQPGAHPQEALTAGKEGRLYLLDRNNLGQYNSTTDNVVQSLPATSGLYGTAAYFNNNVYIGGQNDHFKAFPLVNGTLGATPQQSGPFYGWPGATASISANGNTNGIVWTLQTDGFMKQTPAILHAYDAADVSRELWSSNQITADQAGPAVKFTVPTVADGRVFAGTGNGISAWGLLAAPRALPTYLDYSNGFAGATGLILNGAASIVNNGLQLTDGKYSERSTAFSSTPLNITSFNTSFTFQSTAGANTADGFTFVVQGSSPNYLGNKGGELGYGGDSDDPAPGIPRSICVKFDLYNNRGEGSSSTGLYTNGTTPQGTVGNVALGASGINLHSGDLFAVNMTYGGTTLTVKITDTQTGASATQTYSVDLPSIVGGTSAYVGFTGATGGLTAVQTIRTWTFNKPQVVTSAAVNSGGSAAGGFSSDSFYRGGATYSTSQAIDTSAVTNPAPQAVYKTERYGNFTYTIPNLAPNAAYTVRLHFAEIYWNAPNKRLFNVLLNGNQVLSNFDIFAAAGGRNRAIVKTFSATASATGIISLQFVTLLNNAKISGIEIIPT